jgi:heat shock protein HslJ
MANKIYYLGILFILFGIIRCTSKINTKNPEINPTEKSEEPKLQRIWMLTEFANFEKKFLVDSEAQLNLTNTESAMAKMGCNTLSFKYKNDKSQIIFSKGITTLMACIDMKLEDQFSKEILDFKKYKIDGHTLILYNSKNEKMVYVAQDWD